VVKDRKLVVHEPEAAIVRSIFERFVRIGSATVLARELRSEGVRTKRDNLVDKGYLYKLLNNRTYLGLAVHKGTAHPGEHAAIIDQDLWTRFTPSSPGTPAPGPRTPGRRRRRCCGG
jgi:hypothetical protein